MTVQEVNSALYWKMFQEQEAFKERLASMMPLTVLEYAYEYTCREDILVAMENNDLTEKQATALLKSDTPLADVFHKWRDWETSHIDDVWACMECRANEVLRTDYIVSHKEAR